MTSPFDILFERVRIGPVIALDRFYQVPRWRRGRFGP